MFALNTRILIIDDMATMRKIVMKAFRGLGYTDLIEAADGALGWQALCDSPTPVGMVVSDWNMPNLSGLELLKKVRHDSKFAHLPFVLVTAEAEEHQVVTALAAGVSGYFIKPLDSATLLTKLDAIHKKMHASP